MYGIDAIERGLARYVDEAFLPTLQRGSIKGYALGVGASLLAKRGGVLLREYAKAPMLQQMGLVSADGAVDLDALREAAKQNMPATGLVIDLPMGVTVRLNAQDIDKLYDTIKREASV